MRKVAEGKGVALSKILNAPTWTNQSRFRHIAWFGRIRYRLALSLLCIVALAFVYRQWVHSRPYNDGTWDRIQRGGVMRVGMDASYPPFSDTPSGIPVGLDVDLANEIGRRLGVHIQVVNMGFDGLYDGLQTDQVDALISALSVDPSKLGNVLYTRPYIDAGQVIVATSSSYHQMSDLDGDIVAVEYGSSADEVSRTWQRRLHQLTVIHFTTTDDALAAARMGNADAALVDNIAAQLYRRSHPDIIISEQTVAPEPYRVAVRLSSPDLAGAINAVLNEMADDGTLAVILKRWL